MLGSEAFKRVDAAQPDREDLTAKHLGTLLVAFVKQTLLRCVRLTFGHPASPDAEHKREHASDQESYVPDGLDPRCLRRVGMQPVPEHYGDHYASPQ